MQQIATYAAEQAYQAWDLWDGLVLGILEDPTNTEHQCYLSFITLQDGIDSFYTFKDEYYADLQNVVLSQQYLYGIYAKYGKKVMETSILFFNMYRYDI